MNWHAQIADQGQFWQQSGQLKPYHASHLNHVHIHVTLHQPDQGFLKKNR
jgi:hypothetical protein